MKLLYLSNFLFLSLLASALGACVQSHNMHEELVVSKAQSTS
jgi:hypothetical protein